MPLRPEAVPLDVRPLLALAERWGISDDIDREQMISCATRFELESLAAAVDQVPESLYSWLAGPESHVNPSSAEYVAVTCLTMAADSARVALRDT